MNIVKNYIMPLQGPKQPLQYIKTNPKDLEDTTICKMVDFFRNVALNGGGEDDEINVLSLYDEKYTPLYLCEFPFELWTTPDSFYNDVQKNYLLPDFWILGTTIYEVIHNNWTFGELIFYFHEWHFGNWQDYTKCPPDEYAVFRNKLLKLGYSPSEIDAPAINKIKVLNDKPIVSVVNLVERGILQEIGVDLDLNKGNPTNNNSSDNNPSGNNLKEDLQEIKQMNLDLKTMLVDYEKNFNMFKDFANDILNAVNSVIEKYDGMCSKDSNKE